MSACSILKTDADLVGAGGFEACLEAVFCVTILRAAFRGFFVLAGSISTSRCGAAETAG